MATTAEAIKEAVGTVRFDCPDCGARNTIAKLTKSEVDKTNKSVSVLLQCSECHHYFTIEVV